MRKRLTLGATNNIYSIYHWDFPARPHQDNGVKLNKTSPHKLPLAEQAYQRLFKEIATTKLAPGTHLDEKDLVQNLGIGRTPIREALLRLSSEHLIENVPNKGFSVQPITLQNTKAIFQALWFFEKAVIDLAVNQDLAEILAEMARVNQDLGRAIEADDPWELVKLNNQFHMAFARCSKNEYIVSALRNVRFGSARLAYLSYSDAGSQENNLAQHYQAVVGEHQRIIDALGGRDKETLCAIIQKHLQTFQQRIVSYLTSLSA